MSTTSRPSNELVMRVLLVFALLSLASCQLPSPCPEVLRYEPREKEADRWYATITLQSYVELDGIWLQISLDEPADVLLNWFGESTTSDNKNFRIKNENHVLSAGKILNIKIAVKFSKVGIIPSVTSIKLNGGNVCFGNVRNAAIADVNPQLPKLPPIEENQDLPIVLPKRKSEDVCGTVPLKGRPLVFNGQQADKGQWPWHVALTIAQGEKLTYSCGGSLISTTFVVTAAHCVTKLNTKILLDIQNYFIYLGTNNLREFAAGFQLLQVSEVIIHPEYDPRFYYNDIALIRLSRFAEITDYVRPVCLWSGETNVDGLIGKPGTVVGWGVDSSTFTTKILNEATMPVVSLDTCIFSDRNFFSQYTSEKTYCAGYRNGTTVCRGDSGGGMVFPKADSTPTYPIWQLRGLVSVSYPSSAPCETDHFVVFTDVAKHVKWIKDTAKLK